MRSCKDGLTKLSFGGLLKFSRFFRVWKVKGSGAESSVGVRGPEDDDVDEAADDSPGGDDIPIRLGARKDQETFAPNHHR